MRVCADCDTTRFALLVVFALAVCLSLALLFVLLLHCRRFGFVAYPRGGVHPTRFADNDDNNNGGGKTETKRRPVDLSKDKKLIRARLEAFANGGTPAAMLPDDDGKEGAFIARKCVCAHTPHTHHTHTHHTKTPHTHTHTHTHKMQPNSARTARVGTSVCAPLPASSNPPLLLCTKTYRAHATQSCCPPRCAAAVAGPSSSACARSQWS